MRCSVVFAGCSPCTESEAWLPSPGRAGRSRVVTCRICLAGEEPARACGTEPSDRDVESPPPGRPQWEAQAPQQKPPSFAGPFFEQA